MRLKIFLLSGVLALGLLAPALAQTSANPANPAKAGAAPLAQSVPPASDSTAQALKQAVQAEKAKKLFSICDPGKIEILSKVDAMPGLDEEEKELCKERLKLLNPLMD